MLQYTCVLRNLHMNQKQLEHVVMTLSTVVRWSSLLTTSYAYWLSLFSQWVPMQEHNYGVVGISSSDRLPSHRQTCSSVESEGLGSITSEELSLDGLTHLDWTLWRWGSEWVSGWVSEWESEGVSEGESEWEREGGGGRSWALSWKSKRVLEFTSHRMLPDAVQVFIPSPMCKDSVMIIWKL